MQNALVGRLLTMTDPKTQARMVDAVYKRDDIYKGPFLQNASELQVGFADGYRVSWQTSLGGSPPGIVYPNMKKWSGDHGSFDYKQTLGHADFEPPAGRRPRGHHGYRADGVEVLRRADTVRYRWQADLLRTDSAAEQDRRARGARRARLFSAVFAVSAVSSSYVGRAQTPPERARTEALARRAADRLQALQREADRLTSEERTLLGDLRKLEIERQIKAEELKRVDADAAQVQAELDADSARMDGAAGVGDAPSARSCARGSSRSTSSARPAICACCSRRPTSGASARRRERSPRSPSSIAIASPRTQTTLAELKNDAPGARRRAARSSRRSAPAPQNAQAAAQRAAQARRPTSSATSTAGAI